jgi:hypothetical protein
VNVFQATPTTYEMLLATGWTGDRDIDFLVGGEAFRPSLIPITRQCRSFRNVYGPTETTIWSSSFELTQSYFDGTPSNTAPVIPIGKPISETDFYLVDAEAVEKGVFRLVNSQAGEEGELCIGGIGVAKGYIHAPDLTAARFVANPFGAGLIYRTGDLVRMLPSGDFVFVRRLDDQVKVDGFRIELAEIESVYGKHPLVEQAVVIVRLGKLSAYLKVCGDRELSASELEEVRSFAAQSLTYYMIPTYTTIVKAFPQTANGKLDRKALPDPVVPSIVRASVGDTEDNMSDSSMSSHVRRLIRAQRGLSPKATSTFAAIGVDSLGAVLFVRALSDSLGGIRINPAKMFKVGVTIQVFSDELFARLKEEKPEVVARLGLSAGCDVESPSAGDVSVEDAYESSVSDAMSSNIRLIQGVRGVYTIMG